MNRVIFISPQGADFSGFSASVVPMPGTIEVSGMVVADCYMTQSASSIEVPEGCSVVAAWDVVGGEVVEIAPLSSALLPFLPPEPVFDETGQVVGEVAQPLRVTHVLAGWTDGS